MWSLRCLLIGHDDMLLRRPFRLSLQCRHCGRETHGWSLNRSQSGGSNEQLGVRRGYSGGWSRRLGDGSFLRLASAIAGVFVANRAGKELIGIPDHETETFHRKVATKRQRSADNAFQRFPSGDASSLGHAHGPERNRSACGSDRMWRSWRRRQRLELAPVFGRRDRALPRIPADEDNPPEADVISRVIGLASSVAQWLHPPATHDAPNGLLNGVKAESMAT